MRQFWLLVQRRLKRTAQLGGLRPTRSYGDKATLSGRFFATPRSTVCGVLLGSVTQASLLIPAVS